MKCSIEGCLKKAHARGWCRMHYMRWWEHGNPAIVFRKATTAGEPARHFEAALRHGSNQCFVWPFSKNNKGYAQINLDGKKFLVHRLICEEVNGPPSNERPFAIHSCGNGHLGCISPKHVRWGSCTDNITDMIAHGRSTRGRNAKLTENKVKEIRARLKGGEPQQSIANDFGVSQRAVSKIKRGILWGWL